MLAAVDWVATIDANACVATCCGDIALKPFGWLHVGIGMHSSRVPSVVLSLFFSCVCKADDGIVTTGNVYAIMLPSLLDVFHDVTSAHTFNGAIIFLTVLSLPSL